MTNPVTGPEPSAGPDRNATAQTDRGPAPEVDDEPAAGRGPARQSRGARDMVLSMIVLLIPVAIISFWVWARGGTDPVLVDPAPVIAEAQQDNAFAVAQPQGLPAGWRTVSAVYDPGSPAAPGGLLRIGYLAPSGAGVQLIESNAAKDGLLIRELGDDTRPTGVETIGATTWDSYLARSGDRALVQAQPGRTVIVIGAADVTELRALAASTR